MTVGSPLDPRPAQAGLVVSAITDFADGISAIDTDYIRARLDASHLIVHRGRAAFVDTGTSLAVPRLLAALEAKGVAREAVDWVLLTHIHLDHAGGAGALLAALPNARAVVHPRGVQHLAEPAKLIAATKAVYGEATYARLYGQIVPIPPARLLASEDGMRLELAGRPFELLHTPGHALHHYVIYDPDSGAVFSGDTFGVSYREFDVDGRPFVIPATTPTHFDPDQLHASIDRILALTPRAVYLTHYSRVGDVARLGADLHAGVDAFVALARRYAAQPDRESLMRAAMFEWLASGVAAHGWRGGDDALHALMDGDVEINVQGLVAWLDRRA